jgi:hypothetical protein
VSTVRTRTQDTRRLVAESVAFGLGYTTVLIWGGVALVAAFSPYEAYPYWPAIAHLRTDTTGVLAFGVAAVSLVVAKYLELSRRGNAPAQPTTQSAAQPVARPAGVLLVQAVAEAAAVLATGIVIYLSLNAVVHPWSLRMQLTHLWPWPSEGTVRVIALAICWAAVATRRYLRATATRPSEAGPVAEAGQAERHRGAVPPTWPAPQPRDTWQESTGRLTAMR